MKTKVVDYIDFEKVNTLLEGFNKSTGFVTAILDLEGNVLSKSGWRQICTEFHRINPETSKKCSISDTEIAGKLAEGEKYHFYKCLNGLVDVAVPVVINGEHIANLFSGQFFFEKPDTSFFKKQAAKYGFNEEKYLEALEMVPVVSKEKVLVAMDFLLNMTQLISETIFQKQNQTELHVTLRESEEKFRNVFNNSLVGKSITTMDGRLETNEAFCKILGYSETELSKLKWQEITHPDDVERDENIIKSIISGKDASSSWQKRYLHKNGNVIWVDVSTALHRDQKGNPLYFITSINNITQAKLAEEERQKFVMLADSSSEFIGMFDLEFTPLYVNPAGIRMVGLPDLEAACRVKVQEYFFPEDRQFITEEFFSRVLRDGNGHVEIRLRHFQTGNALWMYYYLYRVCDESGSTVGWATVSRDITESKRAVQDLEESERRYRTLFENMNAGFVLFEVYQNEQGIPEDLIILAANKGFEKTTGLNLRASVGQHLTQVLPGIEKDEADWIGTYTKVALSGESIQFEQGSELLGVYYSVSAFQAGPKQCAVTFIDITERKRTENELKTREQEFRSLAESMPQIVWATRPDGWNIYFNKQWVDYTGMSLEESYGHGWNKPFHPDDQQRAWDAWDHAVKNYGTYAIEARLRRFDGEYRWWLVRGVPLINEKGEILKWFGTCTDIEDMKQTEKALIESRERLNYHYEVSPLANMEWNSDFVITRWTGNSEQIFGWKESETIGKYISDLDMIFEDDFPIVQETMAKLADGSCKMAVSENRNYTKDRKVIHCIWYNTVLTNPEGKMVSVMSRVLDVTEQKMAEEELRTSEAIFKAVAEESPMAIYSSTGSDQRAVYINKSFYKIFGFSREDVPTVGHWWIKAFPDEKYRQQVFDQWASNIEQAAKNNTDVEALECICTCKDGSEKVIAWVGKTIGDEFWAFGHDYTERIKAEKALHESEELLRLSTELANVAAWEFDFTTNSMIRSENHDRLYGLEIQEKWAFETFLNATHPDDREMSNTHIQNAVARGGPDEYRFDFRVVYPDQSIHWLNVIGKVIVRNSEGIGTLVRGFLIDITQRIRTEAKVHNQLEELRRWYEVMINREARVIELKKEVNELLARTGEPFRYASVMKDLPNKEEGLNKG